MSVFDRRIITPHHYDGRGGYSLCQIVEHEIVSNETSGVAIQTARYFQNTSRQASANVTGDDSMNVECVPEEDGAWACPGFNYTGYQFENAGSGHQTRADWLDEYSREMLKTGAKVRAHIVDKYNIPLRHLTLSQVAQQNVAGFLSHWDATAAGVGGNNHTDARYFPWEHSFALIRHELGQGPKPKDPPKPKPRPKDKHVKVDGMIGLDSTEALQQIFNVHPVDLKISGQPDSIWDYDGAPRGLHKTLVYCWPTMILTDHNANGSQTIMGLQKWAGVKQDGFFGPISREALQRKLGVKVDGVPGPETCKALQRKINDWLKEK